MAGAYPGSSEHKIGPHPGEGAPPLQGELTPQPHSQTGAVKTLHFTSHAHLWDVEGNQNPQRKPTQTWGDHANSIDSGPAGINFFFINIVMKGCWME